MDNIYLKNKNVVIILFLIVLSNCGDYLKKVLLPGYTKTSKSLIDNDGIIVVGLESRLNCRCIKAMTI